MRSWPSFHSAPPTPRGTRPAGAGGWATQSLYQGTRPGAGARAVVRAGGVGFVTVAFAGPGGLRAAGLAGSGLARIRLDRIGRELLLAALDVLARLLRLGHRRRLAQERLVGADRARAVAAHAVDLADRVEEVRLGVDEVALEEL